ncbi:peptide deformylase [archaeon]|nr:MAG: peptide deformylase [archaeon]
MSSQRSQNASKSRALTYQLSSLSILPPYSSLSMNFEEETSHYPYGKRVYVVGDAELYQHCEPIPLESITKPEPELLKQVQDAHSVLKNFRAKMGFGRALAAPQVGINRRFIVMKLAGGLPRTLYNPVVTAQSSDMFTMWDDCLSFPDKMCCVQRYTWISISFMDEQGERVDWEKLPQDLSELLQHEIDHLDGVLAIDKAVQPSKNASCAAVIDRAEYLACKQEFDSMVDFCY